MKNFKLKYFSAVSILLLLIYILSPSLLAATTVSITSPSSGSSITSSSFTVSGTATANRSVAVSVNGSPVGSTTSDNSGDWSVSVSGQSVGAKTIQATASGQDLYANVVDAGDIPSSYLSKINVLSKTESNEFSIVSGGLPFLVWKPNCDFTKAYGTAPYLASAQVWVADLENKTTSSFTMAGTTPRAASVGYNSDCSKVYIADNENAVMHVYNTSTDAEIGGGITIGTVGVSHPHGTIHRPGTDEVWETRGGDNEVDVINTLSDTVTDTYTGFTDPNTIAFSPDGEIAYISGSSQIDVVDADTGTITDSISPSGADAPEYMLVNSDGSRLYTSFPTSNYIDVYDTATNSLVDTVTTATGPWGLALSNDGEKLYVSNPNLLGGLSGNTISVIDTSSNTVIDTITTSAAPFFIFFSPVESAADTISFTISGSASSDSEDNTLADTGENVYALATLGISLLVIATILKRRYS